jgi:hypothetical protein
VISFWALPEEIWCIQRYLEVRGSEISDRFNVQPFTWSDSIEVPGGPQIFAAIDRLTPPERTAAGALFAQLAARQPGVPLLNDPTACLLRPALLDLLASEGVNTFRAYPVSSVPPNLRFPVFIRQAHGHDGNLTPLLRTHGELRRALFSLRLRGRTDEELLVVEFCDTSNGDGGFRKYAAFAIGDRVIPAHLIVGRNWMVKFGDRQITWEIVREELEFLQTNPHEKQLREICRLARVQYGRIDYGMLGDRLQVWEINLNPTIGRRPGVTMEQMAPDLDAAWRHGRDIAHEQLRDAFRALDSGHPVAAMKLTLHPSLTATITRTSSRIRRRRAVRGMLHSLYHRARRAAPLRAVIDRVLPRA